MMRRLAGWGLVLALAGGCTPPASEAPFQSSADYASSPAMANVQLGIGYMQRGNLELALTKLQRALSQDPGLPAAHNAVAILYERLGQDELADEHYRTAISLNGSDSAAHNNYGQFLCRRDRFADAERHFQAAVANPLYDTPEAAYTNAALCALRQNQQAAAEGYLSKALQAQPGFAPALLESARIEIAKHDYQKARGLLQRYQVVAPQSAASLWLAVQVERGLGNRAAAAAMTQALKKQFPDSSESRQPMQLEKNER